LLQNAVDSIEEAKKESGSTSYQGKVEIRVELENGKLTVSVSDNGKGFPDGEERDRITEPYVTTREKGTGLGLAIVRKILEDHGGELVFEDLPKEGAIVSLIFTLEKVVSH
jgi:two-component system nitrogen regulation sensor histidine kinase NtrY